MASRIDSVRWLQPWRAVTDDVRREALERELHREVGRGHPLFHVDVRAVARRMDRDEICFQIGDTSQLAVVRLTYALSQVPPLPETRIFDGVDAFIEECMMPDHRLWATPSVPR